MSQQFDPAEAAAVHFLLHVFFCAKCPRVQQAGDLIWLRATAQPTSRPFAGVRHERAPDWREATRVAVEVPLWESDEPRGTEHGVRFLCPDGFALAKVTRAGWGA